jgi:hypothetical protein
MPFKYQTSLFVLRRRKPRLPEGVNDNMEYCSKCGTQIPEGSRFCPKCGQPVEYAERVYEPEVQESVRSTPRTPAAPAAADATGALVVGILALVCGCIIWPVGCCLGIVAIAMGSSAQHRGAPNAGVAIALGVVALIIAIVSFALVFYVLSQFLYYY